MDVTDINNLIYAAATIMTQHRMSSVKEQK